MVERLRHLLLHLLRVPPAPAAPSGGPGTLRVFRAAKTFYRLRLAAWAFTQCAAFAGILFTLSLVRSVRAEIDSRRMTRSTEAPDAPISPAERPGRGSKMPRSRANNPWEFARLIAPRLPWWVLPVATVFEAMVFLGFLLSLPVTYAAVRLDYELRWYLVTDRSLRIRQGIWGLHELTMSFANLQQVVVSQGPLQRLLGIADLKVQSAGGGGDEHQRGSTSTSLHTGTFHGVKNAAEIRDLILDRLRQFREAGLGDPDDRDGLVGSKDTGVQQAADELLAETRALREAMMTNRG